MILIKATLGTLPVLSSLNIDLDEFKDVELLEEDRKKLNEYIEENSWCKNSTFLSIEKKRR